MQITKKSLESFKKIYLKNFGEQISDKEALIFAIPLLNLSKSVLFPNLKKVGEKY